MKTLKRFSFGNVSEKFSDSMLKAVIGGYYDGPWCCAYNTHGGYGGICLNGGGSPAEAEFMAGSDGWWGCNTEEVWDNCREVC